MGEADKVMGAWCTYLAVVDLVLAVRVRKRLLMPDGVNDIVAIANDVGEVLVIADRTVLDMAVSVTMGGGLDLLVDDLDWLQLSLWEGKATVRPPSPTQASPETSRQQRTGGCPSSAASVESSV